MATPVVPEVTVSSGEVQADPVMADVEKEVNVAARQYLEDNVVHVLLQGLKVLARERPENPADYLAMYLLKKNPNKNISVDVPLKS
jgi:hypothetical protein